jgi:hypothetical protein
VSTAPVAAHIDGAVVVVDRVTPRLAAMLRAAARSAERNGARLPDDLAEVLAVVETAAAAVTARQVPRPAPPRVPPLAATGSAPTASTSERLGLLGVRDVARLAGCTERAVRKAAAQERLVGRRSAHGWWEFTRHHTHTWIARRRTRGSADNGEAAGHRAGGC